MDARGKANQPRVETESASFEWLHVVIGVPHNRIHAIVNGTRDITTDTVL